MGPHRPVERSTSSGPPEAEPTSPGRVIIFLHLGKTAGTTMRRVLRRQYPSSAVVTIRNRSVRGKAASGRLNREATLDYFARSAEADRRRARLIIAHTIYGLHEYVPAPSTYITLLRHPVALTLSQYRYVTRNPRHPLHGAAGTMPLAEYVASGLTLEADNSQTRAISGDTTTPFGECTVEMLETAKTNIECHFSVVGLTERFDETLLLLRRSFGWRRIHYVRANVAPSGKREVLPEDTIKAIESQNRFDLALYDWAAARFQELLTRDPSFPTELQAFRRRNTLYAPWGHLTYTLPKRLLERRRRSKG